MKEPIGIRGWLAWFIVVVLGLGGIMGGIVFTVGFLRESNYVSALIGAASVVLAALALVFMCKKNPKGVFFAKAYLTLHFILAGFELVLGTAAGATEGHELRIVALRSIISSILWLAYIFHSKRVRNTYAITPQAAVLATVAGAK